MAENSSDSENHDSSNEDNNPRPDLDDLGDDFYFTQLPNPSPTPSPELSPTLSQSPYRNSQHFTLSQQDSQNFWSQADSQSRQIKFNLNEGSQLESQTQASQFYCSQCDEVAFCSQSIPVNYKAQTYDINSSKCLPQYRKTILKHFRSLDKQFTPSCDIFANQSKITEADRDEEVNWMLDNMCKLDVSTAAIFLCVRLFDRVISKIELTKDNISLYSLASLSLGAKFENSFAQPVSSYADSSERFTDDEIIDCEKEILRELSFDIWQPTEYFFLKMWRNEIGANDEIMFAMAFVGFCSFLDSSIRKEPAELVAAAIYNIVISSISPSFSYKVINDTIEYYDHPDLDSIEKRIVAMIQNVIVDENSSIYEFFSIPERKSVAVKYKYAPKSHKRKKALF